MLPAMSPLTVRLPRGLTGRRNTMGATLTVPSPHPSPMPAKATEDEMSRWLWRHFVSNSWGIVPQLTVSMDDTTSGTQPSLDAVDAPGDRRIDLLAARRSRNPLRTGALESMAIEIKVSRADFLSDVKNPAKQAPWRSAATRHTYAVPAGLVQANEVPAGSGLLWVTPPTHPHGLPDVTWVRKAPYIAGHKPKVPLRVWIALLHRATYLEGTTRGWGYGGGVATETPEELRAALKGAEKRIEKHAAAAEAARLQAEAWKRAYALATPTGLPCGICGNPIKPCYPTRDWFRQWKHIDSAHDQVCETRDLENRISEAKADHAAATPAEFEARLRGVHRYGFQDAVSAEPWRAYFSPITGRPHPAPAFPGEAL